MEDDDDEEEALQLQQVQLLLHLIGVAVAVLLLVPEERGSSFFDQRLAWDEYCERHSQRGTFRIRMRMERASFDQLLGFIHEDLLVSETTYAKRRGETIVPELCLYCTLRYLAVDHTFISATMLEYPKLLSTGSSGRQSLA